MRDWTTTQLPIIARRVLAERDSGREVDPYRIAWANDVLRYFDTRDAAIAARLGLVVHTTELAA